MNFLWSTLPCKKVAFNVWKYFKRRNDNKFQSSWFLYDCFLSFHICLHSQQLHQDHSGVHLFTYQKALLITEHFLGFCPRALGFKLLCWPLLTNGEMLLPIILSHPPCMPLVHNDIFEALNLFAKGTKCRCVLGLKLVTCRKEYRGWLNKLWSKDWVKSLWIHNLKHTNGQKLNVWNLLIHNSTFTYQNKP